VRLRRYQSRRALLWGLGTFLTVQLCAMLLLTRWMPGVRNPGYGPKLQRLEALQARHPRGTLTVVVIGTSRTLFGLDGKLAESLLEQNLGRPVNVCNFGVCSATYFTHLLNLRRLLSDGHRPDFLILEVFPAMHHRGFPLYDTAETFVPTASLRDWELSYLARYARDRKVIRCEWWLQWLSSVHTYRQNLLSRLVPSWQRRLQPQHQAEGDAWGWRPLPREMYTPAQAAKAQVKTREVYSGTLQQLDPGGDPLELLTSILELCRSEQISTGMLLMPEGPTFRSLYGPGKLEQSQRILDGLSHHFEIPFINAQSWVEDEADYLDSHHLLVPGAEAFTRRLACEALPPLLRYHGSMEHPGIAKAKQE
jgi:hypothetical protein